MKNNFDLATVKKSLTTGAANFLKDLQGEIVQEEQDALKDFVKGAYRFSLEKEREIERLQKEVTQIKESLEKANTGDWEQLSTIKIPARFFEESTLRKHGKSLISGSQEVRFVDLYVPDGE